MDIKDFISKYENYPVLFIGSGFSKRYLNKSYTWDELLSKISFDMFESDENYFDLKYECTKDTITDYPLVATKLENIFNQHVKLNRNGKFKEINDTFYSNMKKNVELSRFKIYISELLSNYEIKTSIKEEFTELIKVRKNISSVITTNYDTLIEDIFEFEPLIGNNILMSNPYGSIYKVHGCVKYPEHIIITEDDYSKFEKKYELIRSQLLSLFIHNPIIFIGYNVGDENIRNILHTIFSYVSPNSEEAEKIKSNFLLVEYDHGSTNTIVTDHDITMEDKTILQINKLKTDNFLSLYKELANLYLPVSIMDIRKVQSIVKEIYEGGNIKVEIVGNIDDLKNSDKVLAIGNKENIQYKFKQPAEIIKDYFKIIEEEDFRILDLIGQLKIQKQQYFPIFAFSKLNNKIPNQEELKQNLINNLKHYYKKNLHNTPTYSSIEKIMNLEKIAPSSRLKVLTLSTLSKDVNIESVKEFLKEKILEEQKISTDIRRLICAYDFIKYADEQELKQVVS